MFKHAFTALALAGTLASAQASAVLLHQGFDDVSTLGSAGWIITNAAPVAGVTDPWVQGDQTLFTAQSGSANSFISSNFNNVPDGGTLSSWLITPTFSTTTNLTISFWVISATEDGYLDHFSFGLSDGGGDITDFVMGAVIAAPQGIWTEYTVQVAGTGTNSVARFAIAYVGEAASANHIGVDSLTVTTADPNAVPEPATLALLGISGLGLAAARRHRTRQGGAATCSGVASC